MVRPLALALLCAGTAHAQDTARLTLRIDGLESAEGQVIIVVFDNPDAFPDTPDKAVRSAVERTVAPVTTVSFDGLAPGTYAAFAFHDVNGNTALDVRSVIPIPKEPLGASRGAKGRFGPPKFADAAFTVAAGADHTETITVGPLM